MSAFLMTYVGAALQSPLVHADWAEFSVQNKLVRFGATLEGFIWKNNGLAAQLSVATKPVKHVRYDAVRV